MRCHVSSWSACTGRMFQGQSGHKALLSRRASGVFYRCLRCSRLSHGFLLPVAVSFRRRLAPVVSLFRAQSRGRACGRVSAPARFARLIARARRRTHLARRFPPGFFSRPRPSLSAETPKGGPGSRPSLLLFYTMIGENQAPGGSIMKNFQCFGCQPTRKAVARPQAAASGMQGVLQTLNDIVPFGCANREFSHPRKAIPEPGLRRSRVAVENAVAPNFPEVCCRVRRRPYDRGYMLHTAVQKGNDTHGTSRRFANLPIPCAPRSCVFLRYTVYIEILVPQSTNCPRNCLFHVELQEWDSAGADCNNSDVVPTNNSLFQVFSIFSLFILKNASNAQCIFAKRHGLSYSRYQLPHGIPFVCLSRCRANSFNPDGLAIDDDANIRTPIPTLDITFVSNERYSQIHLEPTLIELSRKFIQKIRVRMILEVEPHILARLSSPLRTAIFRVSKSPVNVIYVFAIIVEQQAFHHCVFLKPGPIRFSQAAARSVQASISASGCPASSAFIQARQRSRER